MPFTFSPHSGPAGTVITASGSGCATEVDTRVEVVLSTQSGTGLATAFSAVIPANGQGGNWTVMITVPAGTPAGTYDLQAFCEIAPGGDSTDALSVPNPPATVGFITYTPGQFVVPPVIPVTAAPVTPPAVTPVPGAPAPTPAPPVAAAPRTAG